MEGKDHPPLEWPDFSPSFRVMVSDGAKDLLTKMFEVEPQKRIAMEDVMEHRWLQEEVSEKHPVHHRINVC